MKMTWQTFLRAFVAGAILVAVAHAQSPAPVVVQAASPVNVPAAKIVPAVAPSASILTALKALDEVRAANAEAIKKQEAVLDKLDEMQKAADQLRIFAHRSGG
jgi:hypothetical protein